MKAIEHICTVRSFKMLTPTVFELRFESNNPLSFTAGQFVSVIIPGAGPNGRDLRRAYSVASAPETFPLELCIKLVDGGPGTQYLFKLREGDTFKAMAPYGDFVYKHKPGRELCLIATGTGIAPFRSMLLSKHIQENPPKKIHCFFGVRTEDELLYLEELGKREGLRFVSSVSQGSITWTGIRGRVTDFIRGPSADIDWLNTDYYLCGHGSMISEIKAFLTEKGVPKDAIHQEIYYK